MHRSRIIVIVATVAALVCATILGATILGVATTHHATTPRPCGSESDVNCFWNAHEQGNRRGVSFYVHRFWLQDTGWVVCYAYPRHRGLDHCTTDLP